MGTDLFVYGSLLFDDVFRAVTGRAAPRAPAVLEGYARYCVRGATYPAIVPEAGARTEGAVYAALDARAVRALDRFEGEMYVREQVEVSRPDGAPWSVETYVFAEHLRDLLAPELWHPDEHGPAARAALGDGGHEDPTR